MECPNCRNRVNPYSSRCAYCGAVIPPGQYLLEESGIVKSRTPVKSSTTSRSQGAMVRTASLGDRMVAAVLDLTVMLGAFSIIGAWSFKRWGVTDVASIQFTAASLLITGTLSALLLFLYLWLLEGCFGATLGKIVVGIRVARRDGQINLAASAIRNGARLVDGIGFYILGVIVAGCSKLRQRIGDILAGTVVIEESFAASTKVFAAVLWLGALIGAGWLLPRICSTGFSNQRPRYLGRTVLQLGYTADSAYLSISGVRVDLRPDSTPRSENVASVDSSH